MYDVICIGGATQDIFFIDPNLPVKGEDLTLEWGEKFMVKDALISFGGGAANSSVGLVRLGFKTAFWGQVGQDLPGEEIAKNLKSEKVSLEFLKLSEKTKTSISAVMVGMGGEHSIVMYRGTNDDLEDAAGHLEDDLSKSTFFYLADAGSSSGALTTTVLQLIKKYNIKLAFVPGQNQLKLGLSKLSPILQNTELFVLNVYEAYELLEWEYEKTALNACGNIVPKVKEAFKKFSDLGAKNIVITRDICGAQGFDGNNYYEALPPVLPEKVDTTGAGDAFAVGVLAAFLKGQSLDVGLRWGTAESGAVISAFGAQPGLLQKLPA